MRATFTFLAATIAFQSALGAPQVHHHHANFAHLVNSRHLHLYDTDNASNEIHLHSRQMSGTEEDEDLVHNYTLNTQHNLDEFFQRLKSFVYMGTFDVNGLEFQTQDLHEKLTSIRQDLEMMPSSPLLLEQLNFAHIMFSGMSDAVIMLQHFNTCELPGHGWLYKIIELNVRLWTMFDSYGNLDLDVSCYVARILEFLRDVHVWGRQFRMLKDVTEDMTALYESQSTEAVKKIFELGSQIPLPHK